MSQICEKCHSARFAGVYKVRAKMLMLCAGCGLNSGGSLLCSNPLARPFTPKPEYSVPQEITILNKILRHEL